MRSLAISAFIFCSLTCAGTPSERAVAAEDNRPDILVIMPDQWRGDCLSQVGHAVVETPNLDQLAREGTLFRRAYTTVSSCIPARYGFLTGMFPHTSGVVGFRQKTLEVTPFPALLRRASYTTAIVGKDQHQNAASGDCGYEINIYGTVRQKHQPVCHYDLDLAKAHPEFREVNQTLQHMGVTWNHWEATSWSLSDEIHPVEWTARQCRQIVTDADPTRPLYLHASFIAPHPPLYPLKKYFEKYKRSKLPEIARGNWVEWDELPVNQLVGAGNRVLLKGETLSNAQAGYYGLIEQIDATVGPLITEFKARSEKAGRPWLIIITSDHGEMMGDHGYFRKCEPYEGSANIPFIVCGSNQLRFKSGQVSYEPVCLEDILPTLFGAASIEVPDHVEGTSLLAVLRGEAEEIRDFLHFEHANCYTTAQAYHALTDGQLKYIWRPLDGREQLFDLNADIQELHDLSEIPSHSTQLQTFRRRLVDRLAARPEGFSQDGKLIPGRPYPPLHSGLRQ